jgi:hypothetical protein
MNNFRILFCFLLFTLAFISCEKPPGEGGSASVMGRIWIKDYPTLQEYAGYDEYVYIVYGDEVSYGDRVRTTYDGRFKFSYLRKGKYKIYAYSMALTSLQDSAVIRSFEITDRKEKADLGDILLFK